MTKSLRTVLVTWGVLAIALLPSTPSHCALTELVSVGPSGVQANSASRSPSISADGRFVAFGSWATNLVPWEPYIPNVNGQVYVRDRATGATQRVSETSPTAETGAWSPAISTDGRFVAYTCYFWQPGVDSPLVYVAVRDRLTGASEVISRYYQSGTPAEADHASISADGRFVAFDSSRPVIDDFFTGHVYVRDRLTQATELISVSSSGQAARLAAGLPSISADGRYVAFASSADNLVADDTNAAWDIFVRDRQAGTTERISVNSSGEQGSNGNATYPSISADGRFVAFVSSFTNLVPDDTNGRQDIFVHDRVNRTTERISVSSSGQQADSASHAPAMSGDGRYVAFQSEATNLVPMDVNGRLDVFVRDRTAGVTERVSLTDLGEESNGNSGYAAADLGWDHLAAISGDGSVVAFTSSATNLVPGDFNEYSDIFVRKWPSDPAQPPAPAISINASAQCAGSSTVTLAVWCPSQCAGIRFRNDTGDWSSWQPCTTSKSWTLSAGGGLKRVYAQCCTASGALSQQVSDSIIYTVFKDVPCSHALLPFIAALVGRGITSGCAIAPPLYCPDSSITREQMAVFLCRAAGKGPLDRATPTFCDVPKTNPYYAWIERLADPDSWGGNPPTIGCTPFPCRQYCPSKSVTRDEMAAFLVRANGRLPVSSCAGLFADVDRGGWACPYIERIADAASWPGGVAVTNGCAPGPLYCPYNTVTRGQMAVFLVRAFGIAL